MIPAGTTVGDRPLRHLEPRATALLAKRPELRGLFPIADAVDAGDRD